MGLATQNNLTFTSKSMTNLLNPTQGVINLLSLVSGFIKAGISGVRKKFAEELPTRSRLGNNSKNFGNVATLNSEKQS